MLDWLLATFEVYGVVNEDYKFKVCWESHRDPGWSKFWPMDRPTLSIPSKLDTSSPGVHHPENFWTVCDYYQTYLAFLWYFAQETLVLRQTGTDATCEKKRGEMLGVWDEADGFCEDLYQIWLPPVVDYQRRYDASCGHLNWMMAKYEGYGAVNEDYKSKACWESHRDPEVRTFPWLVEGRDPLLADETLEAEAGPSYPAHPWLLPTLFFPSKHDTSSPCAHHPDYCRPECAHYQAYVAFSWDFAQEVLPSRQTYTEATCDKKRGEMLSVWDEAESF